MFDERPDIADRLEDEVVVWMTTVDPSGQPQSSPVWFLTQPDAFIVYSLAETPRVRNIRQNPKVSLNLNSSHSGGQLVIVEGVAHFEPDGPPATEDPEYMAKYEPILNESGTTPESFARDYPLRIRIVPTRLRAS